MTTARFIAALYVSRNPSVRVERSLRRASMDRAVFYAQVWLTKVQHLAHYCGTTYDSYEVSAVVAEGAARDVVRGDINGALAARLSANKAWRVSDLDEKRVGSAKVRTKAPRSKSRNRRQVWGGLSTQHETKARTIRTEQLSYMQRRLLEMRDNARRANGAQ